MGMADKAKNSANKLGGKSKEGTGRATGNDRLRAEGKGDQSKADLKGAFGKLRSAFKR